MEVVTPDAIPGIHDVNTLTGSESFELCLYEADVPGFRKVALRAQISTSLIGSGGGNLVLWPWILVSFQASRQLCKLCFLLIAHF